mgnify:CR=1 FL=1
MGYSTVRRIMREGLTDPRNLDGIALWNSTRDVTDLTTDTGIKLWADKSGNSSTNVLCLNGVAGNYASAPDSAALSITSDVRLEWYGALVSWASGSRQVILSKYNSTGNQRGYWLAVTATGALEFIQSTDGTAASTFTSSTTLGLSAFAAKWVRATLDVDNGAAGRTVTFETSDDGVTWSALGTAQTVATAANTFDSTAVLNVGGNDAGAFNLPVGIVYRARIYSTPLGTPALQFDANFSLPAKLAPSFTESSSNAATVTINTSGATGARISGARDLYQGTAANQPILTIAAAGNYLTFDGSNDYLKAAAFALAQPETVYFVGSQVTWTSGDAFFDGNALGNGMAVAQNSLTPALSLFAGTQISDLIAPALNARSVISAVFSGAASFLRLNRAAAASASVGVESGNGFTLGCVRNTTGFANITAQEVLVYSGAHDKATQERVIAMLARNNRIALT